MSLNWEKEVRNHLKTSLNRHKTRKFSLKDGVLNMSKNYPHGPYTIVPDDIDCNIDLEFGAYTSIASGLTIVSGQHPPVKNPEVVSTFPFNEWGLSDEYPISKMGGKVWIGSDVWIGQNVTIMDGVSVGSGSIVGAESVVTQPVYPYSIVAGNPAEVKKYRFDGDTREALMRIAWWDWPEEKIRRYVKYMYDVKIFLSRVALDP